MVCCARPSAIYKVGILLLMIGFIINVIGFASPFWSTRTGDFEGLWQICTGTSCVTTVGNGLTNSDWFIANQVLQSVALVIALVGVIIALIFLCSLNMCGCFNACGILVTIKAFLAGTILVAGLTLYGVQSRITNTAVVFLFSYWLVLAAAVLYLISGILLSLAVDRDWKHDDDEKDVEKDDENGDNNGDNNDEKNDEKKDTEE